MRIKESVILDRVRDISEITGAQLDLLAEKNGDCRFPGDEDRARQDAEESKRILDEWFFDEYNAMFEESSG